MWGGGEAPPFTSAGGLTSHPCAPVSAGACAVHRRIKPSLAGGSQTPTLPTYGRHRQPGPCSRGALLGSLGSLHSPATPALPPSKAQGSLRTPAVTLHRHTRSYTQLHPCACTRGVLKGGSPLQDIPLPWGLSRMGLWNGLSAGSMGKGTTSQPPSEAIKPKPKLLQGCRATSLGLQRATLGPASLSPPLGHSHPKPPQATAQAQPFHRCSAFGWGTAGHSRRWWVG